MTNNNDSRAPAAQASATSQAAPGWDKLVEGEKWCLGCDKGGHHTNECPSTHGLNTPWACELYRLCLIANDAATIQEPVMVAEPVACKTCGGAGIVDDGEINCFPNGTPYENGPIKCVKDCPACKSAAPMVADPAGVTFDREEFIREVSVSVAEMDRDSPEGQPEMMLVTPDELQNTMRSVFDRFDEAATIQEPVMVAEPVEMILHCPTCHVQHVDAPDERTVDWTNPPHRSHLCHACGCIWRPADVPTSGVAAIKTSGKADTATPAAELNGGMHASTFAKVWGDAGGGDAGRIALANYAFNLGCRSAAPMVADPADDAGKAVHWFSCLDECAKLLGLADDEPIPSGVVKAIRALVDHAGVALTDDQIRDLWTKSNIPSEENDYTTGFLLFARAILAATVKAVPSEALTDEVLAQICEEAGYANLSMQRLREILAAPLADKTGGGE